MEWLHASGGGGWGPIKEVNHSEKITTKLSVKGLQHKLGYSSRFKQVGTRRGEASWPQVPEEYLLIGP